MTKSKIFFYLCLSFIGGVSWSSFFYPKIFWGFLIFGVILTSILWKNKKIMVAGFCVLVFTFGILRYNLTLSNYESQFLDQESRITNQELIVLKGTVVKEPDIRIDSIRLTISAESMSSKILVTANRYPEYQYGDLLEITGRLEEPKIFPDFDYRGYLMKEGIRYVIYNPQILLIEHNTFCGKKIMEEYPISNTQCYRYKLYKTLSNIKNGLENNIDNFISSPQSGILNAIIWGDEQGIPNDLKDKLNITGTRHIVAVSGMNITIIGGILFSFLIAVGFWRRQAFFFSIIILILFILMIGAPASAVRAGIMAGLLIFAQIFGRVSRISRAVIFAGAAMLVQNSLLLKYDVGFQLSFAAVLGIIYLKPTFDRWFSKFPKNFGVKDILSMTLSAQFAAFPILIYNFGQISAISPFVNILIVSLLPLLTIAGFGVATIGAAWQNLGQVLSWPLWLILTYVVKIIDWFSQFLFASVSVGKGSWVLVVGYYAVLIWLVRKSKIKYQILK